ncbi:MAG TPA: hypothetical protein VNU72_08945 [Puia sp.]|nr:hypothetical protein [Puia sp.]
MAINQNHLFEDLNGVKCAIVEKNVSPARVEFLRGILEYNGYTVMVIDSPPPKAAPAAAKPAAPPAATSESAAPSAPVSPATPEAAAPAPPSSPAPPPPPPPPAPTTFTVGVTDVTFNPVNAIFGRLLKAPGGHIITLAFWQQKEGSPHDEVPYFDAKY